MHGDREAGVGGILGGPLSKDQVGEIVAKLKLQPHPEGGYFRETYRSKEVIDHGALPKRYRGSRSFGTAIYYLLGPQDRSCLHRIRSDEIWHFYRGGPLQLVQLNLDGSCQTHLIGPDFMKGQVLQHWVPQGAWFGAYPDPSAEYGRRVAGCDCP